ncbi:acyltransferase family protein [Ectobacillus sp. JY-23]|uniref:acyltransferase family protein n=1 Tax=Ectobacillus sp. JY-23 TaxID=2933872 RepID=UPI001FF57D6F|nr:acyltransferase family protein [Ectobacillus sp. JY-23]UOY92472.1 acyltransferase family protein [Ectobacillus sp. JY-23]
MNRREEWLDAAKGFAMILVVAGHAYQQSDIITFIYWFHMPAFFLFSGYVSRPVENWSQVGSYIKKRFYGLLIPYITYMAIFTVCRYTTELLQGNTSLSWYLSDLGQLLVGGRFITGHYGVFWFVTCLFFTQILFVLLQLTIKKEALRLLSIGLFYVLAHIQGTVVSTLPGKEPSLHVLMPWNLDVTMLALFYYSIGYYAKPLLRRVPKWLTAGSLVLTVGAMILHKQGIIDYHLSMKYLTYNDYVLDAIIPLAMTIAYCGLFQMLRSVHIQSFLSFINQKSMAIMYMHVSVNKILLEVFDYGNIMFTLLGVTIPIVIVIVVSQYKQWIHVIKSRSIAWRDMPAMMVMQRKM